MKEIEDLLREKKEELEALEMPEDMEERLSQILDKEKRKRFPRQRIAIVACLIITILFSYNYEVLADYGKKILGYDTVMSQTLQDLNELGKGQEIGKKVTFKNEVELTLDGIMVDDNQLLVFYRIRDPRAKDGDTSFSMIPTIRGLFKEYTPSSGQGEFKEDQHELIMVHSFEPLDFYEQNLKFQGNFESNGQFEEFSIPFSLDRRKAMGHSIKQKINKKINLDNQEVHLKNIIATETQTLVKGSLGSPLDLFREQLLGEQVRPEINFNLIADGKVMEPLGSGLSTSMKGIEVEHRFDALPKNLKELKLQIKNLRVDKKIDEIVEIKRGEKKKIEIEGRKIEILHIENSIEGRTEVTIESQEDVLLPGIELIIDGQATQLEMTHSEEYRKTNQAIVKKRILSFKGTGEELQLKLKHIHYEKEFNEIIDIPIR